MCIRNQTTNTVDKRNCVLVKIVLFSQSSQLFLDFDILEFVNLKHYFFCLIWSTCVVFVLWNKIGGCVKINSFTFMNCWSNSQLLVSNMLTMCVQKYLHRHSCRNSWDTACRNSWNTLLNKFLKCRSNLCPFSRQSIQLWEIIYVIVTNYKNTKWFFSEFCIRKDIIFYNKWNEFYNNQILYNRHKLDVEHTLVRFCILNHWEQRK